MGLKEILEALEQEAAKTEKEIHERALAQAQRIREESKVRAEETKKLLLEQEQKKIEQEAKNIVSAAEAEARKILSKAKQETFELVRKKLEELISREPEIKEAFFRFALEDAVSLLNGQLSQAKIDVSSQDSQTVEKVVKEMGLELPVSATNGIKSGFAIILNDGKIAVRLTPELAAERLMKLYVKEIAEKLTGLADGTA